MAGKIKAMWTNKDIRNRILFTLFAFLVYRLGSAITVPDVNTADLVNGIGENSLFAMLNLLGGGGLEQFSVFALGVTPYITASIIIQLLSMDVIPHLTELSKAGANGRKTLDKYTRYLAVVFAFVQSFSLVYGFSKAYTGLIVGGVTISKILYIATIFAAGSMFLVWVGDQISMKGIGNGAGSVYMRPAIEGTGVIAGGATRAILELAGISDILTKCLGSRTKINVVRATVDGLQNLRTVESVAALRGKKPEEIRG